MTLSSARPSGQTPPDAIDFDTLVQAGRDSGAPIINGMPWSFTYRGWPVTHENDDCYIVCKPEGSVYVRRSPSEGTPAASVEGTTPPSLRELAERLEHGECDAALVNEYIAAANPAAILELLAEVESLRSALREARLIGAQMSNLCFNLSQLSGTTLSHRNCEIMDELRRKWDAAAGSTTP